MQENDYANRTNKLDSFLLWVASLSGVGFSILIGYFHFPWIPYLPIFLLIILAVALGYVEGAILSDSFTNRIRGWTYLLMGLSIYVPLTVVRFTESSITQISFSMQGIESSIGVFAALVIAVSFAVICRKIGNPFLYKSFGKEYENVTKKILNRTFLASLVLGFTLYVFAVWLNQFSLDFSSVLYVIMIILVITPMILEERKIGKLLPLEKYQLHVNILTLEKKTIFRSSLLLLMTISLSMLIILQFPLGNLLIPISYALGLAFIVGVFGMYFGLFLSDKGDMVMKRESCENQLSEEQQVELNKLLNKING